MPTLPWQSTSIGGVNVQCHHQFLAVVATAALDVTFPQYATMRVKQGLIEVPLLTKV